MIPPTRLCLNMIVKNETANLPRCLTALAPHIACWVIVDTGSSDGTHDLIRSFFAERGIPGELHSAPFVNFEQARNAALDRAEASPLAFDYMLFADADMELVVEDAACLTGLTAERYRLLQRAGISYWNTRLARRGIGARYVGVTHEYLDAPGEERPIAGAWYIDHATGSNRVDKFERDIALLKAALEREPENPRYWFYLAQSLRDAGQLAEAAEAYGRRAGMGGWAEEAWHAKLSQARCLDMIGDSDGFLREALAAHDMRPHRAEALYSLARAHRIAGRNNASLLFAEAGMALPYPKDDSLFVEDFVYETGLREEFSIVAYYSADPALKRRGFEICEALALGRATPEAARSQARRNLTYYVGPLAGFAPSFQARPLDFTPPPGWRAMNPSIARQGDEIVLSARTVNYLIGETGAYDMPQGGTIRTRNYLLRLDDDLVTRSAVEIDPPADMPPPAFPEVLGFEDPRLFAWRGALWCVSNVRELASEGWCQQVLARLAETPDGRCQMADWRILTPEGPRRHEKNWMPFVDGEALGFVYGCDPTRLLDAEARTTALSTPNIAADDFRGGSQAIAFDGGWLAVVHEAPFGQAYHSRTYHHRFVRLDAGGALVAMSEPFHFGTVGIEFAAGMAWHPGGQRLMISYGVKDREAWIATVDAAEVQALLHPI